MSALHVVPPCEIVFDELIERAHVHNPEAGQGGSRAGVVQLRKWTREVRAREACRGPGQHCAGRPLLPRRHPEALGPTPRRRGDRLGVPWAGHSRTLGLQGGLEPGKQKWVSWPLYLLNGGGEIFKASQLGCRLQPSWRRFPWAANASQPRPIGRAHAPALLRNSSTTEAHGAGAASSEGQSCDLAADSE